VNRTKKPVKEKGGGKTPKKEGEVCKRGKQENQALRGWGIEKEKRGNLVKTRGPGTAITA